MSVQKDAKKLADRINELPGYSAELVMGGSHGGGAFQVRGPNGEKVARFSAHASYGGLALVRAEAEMRRLGVPLPRNDVTPTKEDRMATVGAEGKELTVSLRKRLRETLASMGGDDAQTRRDLSVRAVETIAFRIEQGITDVEQFGSTGQGKSDPVAIARESIRVLLDKDMNATAKSFARWKVILDALDGEATASTNGHVDSTEPPSWAAEPEPEPVREPSPVQQARAASLLVEAGADAEEFQKQINELQERAELAEGVVAEVELERNVARREMAAEKTRADSAERVLEERNTRIKNQETTIADLQKKLKDKGQTKELVERDKEIRSLKRQLQGANSGATRALNNLTRKLRKAEGEAEAVYIQLEAQAVEAERNELALKAQLTRALDSRDRQVTMRAQHEMACEAREQALWRVHEAGVMALLDAVGDAAGKEPLRGTVRDLLEAASKVVNPDTEPGA